MARQMVAQTVLDEIGWNNRYAVPVANAENKRLEGELQNLNRQLQQVQGKLAHDEDRVYAITEHLKNVRIELCHTHALYDAQVKAFDTEIHLRKVADRESGRIQQELNKLDKDLRDQKEKKNFFENTIFKQQQRIEQKKSQMNWDNQALEAWLKECKRRDDDAMTLAKYTREDDDKIREITLKMNNMTEELTKKRRQLDHESMDTQTAQVELDKTAEEFRKAHLDRQQLLHQWETTIDQMSKRDQEMNILALELEQTKAEVRSKENLCKEKLQFLLDGRANNQDVENQIMKSERDISALKMQLNEAEKECNEMQSSLNTLKTTTDRTNSDLEVARAEVTHFKQEIVDKTKRLENIRLIIKNLHEKLEQTMDSKLGAEERSARLLELLNQEEHNVIAMTAELKHLREIKFTKTQDITDLKSELKKIDVQIQGTRATIVNLNSKIRDKDKEVLRQEEMIYGYDLGIQAAQRRVSVMEGNQSNDEKVAMEARIRELKKVLNQRISIHNLLSTENKRQQDEIRKVKRALETSLAGKETLKRKIDELQLHLENAQRALTRSINEKQDKMVDKNLLDLRVRKLLEELHRQAGEVLSQEKHRLKLETAMKERRLEIDIHVKMLTAQLRDAEEQRRDTNIQLQERISRIERLRKRYESIIIVMAPPEGEEARSQSYYVIRAAQEKEELQRKGDELDAKIRKGEKEICALRNTLKVMRSSNEIVRKDQTKINEESDELQEKHVLEEQHKTLIDKFRHKRGLLRERQEDTQRMIQNRNNMIQEGETLAAGIDDKQEKLLQLTKDVEDQITKLNRVNKLNLKLLRSIRNALKVKEAEEEGDIDLRDLRELNKKALKQMCESVEKHPELACSVQKYFEQAGFPLPVPSGIPGSRSSSGSLSSVRSSLFSSGSLTSVRSASSSRATLKDKRELRLAAKEKSSVVPFTVFGDDLIVKPPSSGSSHSTLRHAPSSKRSSGSSATIKEFTVFGDDLFVKGSSHSSASSQRSDRSFPAVEDLHLARPSLPEDVVASDFHGKSLSTLGRERAASLTRGKPRSGDKISSDYMTASRHSTGRSRQDPRKPVTETFTVFGGEQLDFKAPSRQSSGSNRSSHGGV